MNTLAELFVDRKCTEDICRHFQPIVLDIAQRAKATVVKTDDPFMCKRFAVALSRGLHVSPDVQR